jgi:hypothetical protein
MEKPLRDEKGRLLPGQVLNPAGKPKGIANRNTQLDRAFDAFRASPKLCATALKRYGIELKDQGAEGALLLLAFAKSIVDRDDSLLKWCGEKLYLDQSPAAAGIVINASANATSQSSNETNVYPSQFERLLGDGQGRDALAVLAQRAAACGLFSGDARHVRQ